MPKLPTVAIIGRPNTGKSRLFNRLSGKRRAIVSDTPGTTRDHIAARTTLNSLDCLLVDTGGMGGGTEDIDLEDDVHQQSLLALQNADVILFTVNSQEELTASDHEIVNILRKNRKRHVPVLLVVTKCDDPSKIDELLPQYYQLGLTDAVIPVSSIHKFGFEDLTHSIESTLLDLQFRPQDDDQDQGQERMARIALIGVPNVGKSSIINAYMNDQQRETSPLLVSDIPGTTRDSTDNIIKYYDKEYMFIDTAGIKRRKSTKEGIETYAYFRSIQSLQESDITVLVLDASDEGVSRQEKRIAGMAIDEGKGLVILLNKIDLLSIEERKLKQQEIRHELAFCSYAPIVPCSAESRVGLLKLFDQIALVERNRSRRIQTKILQEWYRDSVYQQPMDVLGKSKHITQAEGVPPTFVIFVKDPKKVQVSQLRYLDNRLRETFAFEGVPVRWITKGG